MPIRIQIRLFDLGWSFSEPERWRIWQADSAQYSLRWQSPTCLLQESVLESMFFERIHRLILIFASNSWLAFDECCTEAAWASENFTPMIDILLTLPVGRRQIRGLHRSLVIHWDSVPLHPLPLRWHPINLWSRLRWWHAMMQSDRQGDMMCRSGSLNIKLDWCWESRTKMSYLLLVCKQHTAGIRASPRSLPRP